MTDVNQLIDELIAREGGYVNDPTDRGGETNYGITASVARLQGYTGPMRDMPRDVAAAIYKKLYWTRPGFDLVARIYPRVAAELFDTGVNMGPQKAGEFLQRVLNALSLGSTPHLTVDGAIGQATCNALGGFYRLRGMTGEDVLVHALDALQGARYVEICEKNPTQSKFLFGWLSKRLGNA